MLPVEAGFAARQKPPPEDHHGIMDAAEGPRHLGAVVMAFMTAVIQPAGDGERPRHAAVHQVPSWTSVQISPSGRGESMGAFIATG